MAALFIAAAFSSCSKHDNVDMPDLPENRELAITFAEGNSLEFDAGETKIVHYTITGNRANNNKIMKVEMQTDDYAYTVERTSTSATEGTITITANMPETENCVLFTVSDGPQTVTAEIAVSTKSSALGITITVETPGTLSALLIYYDTTKITELTVIGNLNRSDIWTLNNLPNLAVLDMEHVNLEVLPDIAFQDNKSLTSVKLPQTLKTIGSWAFSGCSSLTSVTIPGSVTEIGDYAFYYCSGLTNITIGNNVKSIGGYAFYDCRNLTNIYCKAQTPPTIESSTFSYWRSCTLYVPTGCKEAYAATRYWQDAKGIIEITFY